MSEEEIIDKYIKEINNLVIAYNNLAEEHLPTKMIGEKIDIFTAMLDLYNKQQKEIEKLKEKAISREKRLEYLRNYGKKHWKEYYENNKEHILKQARERREKVKGKPLQSYNYIGLKNMAKEERNEYYRIKMRECRERKKNKNEM